MRLQRTEGDETEISMRGEMKNLTERSRKVSRMPRQQSNSGRALGFSVVWNGTFGAADYKMRNVEFEVVYDLGRLR